MTQPDEAVKTINAWVSDKTREKIKELIQRDFISDDTRLILTNAIYFKGRWENGIRERPTPGTKTGTAPRHQQGADDAPEGRLPVLRGRRLPGARSSLQGRQLSMLVVLPRKKDGLACAGKPWAAGSDLPAGDGRASITKRRSSSRSPASRWRRSSN